jgi:hypothetical protein
MIIEQSISSVIIDILIILAVLAYAVVTTIVQMRIAKKAHWIFSFVIPFLTSALIFISISNTYLFWILTFFSFGYFQLVFFVKFYTKKDRMIEQKKVNIKDL